MTVQTQILKIEPEPLNPPGERDGRVNLWIAEALIPWLTKEARTLRGLLRRLTVANLSAYYTTGLAVPGVANTEFTVTHNLGRVPVIYIVNVDVNNAIVYDSRRNNWTATQMFLKCSVAGANITLVVL